MNESRGDAETRADALRGRTATRPGPHALSRNTHADENNSHGRGVVVGGIDPRSSSRSLLTAAVVTEGSPAADREKFLS